jgi:hypothetical protein
MSVDFEKALKEFCKSQGINDPEVIEKIRADAKKQMENELHQKFRLAQLQNLRLTGDTMERTKFTRGK